MYRRSLLKNKDFSIISDNCWGGFTYQYFNLPYKTPFVGLFIFSPDYIELLKDLKGYLDMEIRFIPPSQSKYKEELMKNKTFGTYPIGVLDNIEIHFLHYGSEIEAKTKWVRRLNKIDYDNLVVKFCDRDLATERLIEEFTHLNYERKVLLTAKSYGSSSEIVLNGENGFFVEKEWESYLATVNPVQLLNSFHFSQ